MTVPLMSAFYGDSYWTGTDLIISPFGVLVGFACTGSDRLLDCKADYARKDGDISEDPGC
jgi:hypothetical protein